MNAFRLVVLLFVGLLATAIGASPQAVGAQSPDGEVTVTVHARSCPDGYSGDDLFGDCHGFIVTGQDFVWSGVAGDESGETDSDGNLTFVATANSPAIHTPVFLGDSTFVAYCSANGSGEVVPFDYSTANGRGIAFGSLDGFDAITCDWYTIPEAADQFGVSVAAFYCSEQPFEGNGRDVCDVAPGVTIDLATADGQYLGSCETVAGTFEGGPIAACSVEAPFGANVVASVNLSTVAEGFAPTDNSFEYPVPSGPPDGIPNVAIFFLLPVAGEPESTAVPDPDPTDEPDDYRDSVTQLPDTGIGPAPSSSPAGSLAVSLAAMLAFVGLAFARLRFR